ncbi:hypothetical protein CPB86DRAFT_158067 [Serendipita vermifera]|nr:hypothetical protein CPB86DRAFT_158067 [Serendipita vermifera]
MNKVLETSCIVLGWMIFFPILSTLFIFVANPRSFGFFLDHKRPQPLSGEAENVSGLYGPGAYWAWVLCTISAVLSSSAKGDSSSRFSPDQIASFIYSTFSIYSYYIRVAWYGLNGPALLQDQSIQAASFILHISSLFHGLGAIFSIENKRVLWRVFVAWDFWLLWTSPMTTVDSRSLVLIAAVLPIAYCCIVCIIVIYKPWPWKIGPFLLLPFILLEAIRTQYFVAYSFLMSPKTTCKLTDLDQLVSLMSAIVVITYQWGLWKPLTVFQRLRASFRRSPVRSRSIYLESRDVVVE